MEHKLEMSLLKDRYSAATGRLSANATTSIMMRFSSKSLGV
jgi:hypothetical protein